MKRPPLKSTTSPLVLLARTPVAGRAKTRLTPAYTPHEAARFAEALIRDALDLARRQARPTVVRTTGGPHPGLRGAAPHVARWEAQGAGSLGARMGRAFRDCFRRGAKRVVLLGTDSPGLPARYVAAAYRRLARADVVLGPACDGGYYLVGLSRPAPGIFRGVRWGGPSVLRETALRAARLGLTVSLLPLWFDIDRPEDLHTLAGLDALGALRPRPKHTLDCLAELGLRPKVS